MGNLATHKGQTDEELIDNFRVWWNDRTYMGKPSKFSFMVLRNYIKSMRGRDRWSKKKKESK